ncbi:hypothetical protein BP6252_10004 [Coleophoma cylindrospora]|uniref:Major facilitator superfamily (MFS) profile domain-containing protein n=1 Tax=Coleophoma cylindrospora TaxID=1849047 RepID=A0A3D8QX73_9HELO|nr:hypothetical protein BP6252_10004 [Coleophoma cylindrospora]
MTINDSLDGARRSTSSLTPFEPSMTIAAASNSTVDVNTPLLSSPSHHSSPSSHPPPSSHSSRTKHARTWLASAPFAWVGILLLALAISLDAQTVQSLQTYALSTFAANGKLGILSSMQNFVTAAARPPIAIIADSYGRFESFLFSITILTVGFVGLALSPGLDTFMFSQFAYATGQVGIQFMETIIVADTSSLPNRALATAMPMTPWMITVFTAAPIVEALVPDHWRLGYGIWAIIVPVSGIPLLLSLYYREKRAARHQRPQTPKSHSPSIPKASFMQFDIIGFLIFTIGLAFILFSAAYATPGSYSTSSIVIGVLGFILLIIFCYYELHVASHPILALDLARDRTVACGCILAFLLFGGFAIYQPYFYSYLVVSRDASPSIATNLGLVSLFVSVIAGLIASAAVKFTKRYKNIMILGVVIRIVAASLLLFFTTTTSSLTNLTTAQFLVGIGTGMGGIIVQVGVQAAVSARDIATACALYATASSIGNFLGDLISSLIWSSMLLSRLEAELPADAVGNATAIANSIMVAQSYAMGSVEREVINRCYVEVIRTLQGVGLGVFVVALLVCFLMKDIHLDREDPMSREDRIDAESFVE